MNSPVSNLLRTVLPFIGRPASPIIRTLILTMIGIISATIIASAKVTVTVDVGRPSKGCSGFGICRITVDFASTQGVPAVADLHGDSLTVQFTGMPKEHGDILPIDQPLELDEKTSLALGAKGVVLLPGQYPVDYSSNENGTVTVAAQRIGVTIGIDPGRRSKGCTGFGICRIEIGFDLAASPAVPTVGVLDGNSLTLDFLSKMPEQGETLVIDEDIRLDRKTSLALGAENLVVLKGAYPVDYSKNPNGSVTVNARSIGITIGIDVGRKSRGCEGFGICRIDISLDFAMHQVPAAGVFDGNSLTLDFTAQTPQQGDTLVIDEDIRLDRKTSLALGAENLVVQKGTYPVDYSKNPNGSVTVNARSIGITIGIDVGRKSRGCEGFGICRIDISLDFNIADRTIPTAAVLNGNTLTLDFTGTAPEHGDTIFIDENIQLDAKTAAALGAENLVVLKGAYPVNYDKNANGSVDLSVVFMGPIIGIEFGRSRSGCRGFGICHIWIEVDLTNRMVPSVPTLNGNLLTLDFLTKTPEQGDTLVIDEDIRLDRKTSLALGAENLVVLKGAYPVDYSKNPNGSVTVNARSIGITIGIDVGRRSKGCTGFGVCRIEIGLDFAASPAVPAAGVFNGNTLTLDFTAKTPVQGDTLVIDDDIRLDRTTSLALGAENLVVLKGSYPVDYSKNPNGSVTVNARSIGITIGIDVGRRSKGCTGFGVCRIEIGLDFAERTVPTAAVLNGEELTLDFTAKTPEQGDTLIIDEDIELDAKTAAALGAESLVVLKGAYPVDYDTNPNGTVHVAVQRMGITVTILVARPKYGCDRGLGICKITIGLELSARNIPTIATLTGDELKLTFTSALPEDGSVMTIDEELPLDEKVANALGANAVTIMPGEYQIEKNTDGQAVVTLKVMRKGLTVTLYIGRAAYNCERFGICRIIVAAKHDTRAVRAIAELQNGELHVKMLSESPDQEDSITIDEPLELDSATAAAFGYSRFAIMPGKYPVSFDSNAYGTFSVAAVATGTSAAVETGRNESAASVTIFPNPASTTTTMRLVLPQASKTTMTIVDALGRTVAIPVDGTMLEAGEHSVTIDASTLTAGTYYYTVRTDDGIRTGTMQVVR